LDVATARRRNQVSRLVAKLHVWPMNPKRRLSPDTDKIVP